MVLDRIANANINCDERAVLSFEQRPHGKDKRPLEYPIRLCFPLNDRAEDSMWRRVPLVRDNRLAQRAVMLPMKNMIMVESLDDDCPPESGAADLDVNPGDRYCQLGDSATACVLDGTVRALKFTEKCSASHRRRAKNWGLGSVRVAHVAHNERASLLLRNRPAGRSAVDRAFCQNLGAIPFFGRVLEYCGLRALVCGA